MEEVNLIVMSLFGILSVFLLIWAIIDLFRQKGVKTPQKLLCVFLLLLSPAFGALLYFQLKYIFKRKNKSEFKIKI